jgi:pimeloyl-ACP methyl ester carboxylesterase
MGATAAIWSSFIAARPRNWSGRIVALDLPGHGASSYLERYDMPAVASTVAAAVGEFLAESGAYRVLGHSYGGVVALELARLAAGRAPDRVYGLGIKTVWTDAEVAGMHRLARKPPKLYSDPQAAADWYLKVSGIAGPKSAGADSSARGIIESPAGQWRLAQDPKVYALTPPDMAALTRNLQGRFALGYGAEDTMVDAQDLARTDPAVCRLEGGGHNIMVNNPGAVWSWIT